MTRRMPVTIEVPRPWLESPRDGARNAAMFSALASAAEERDYAIEYEDIAFGSTFQRRVAPPGGFRLAYHSCGDSRHVWRLKESPVPWFYSFDRLGFSGWAETAVFLEKYRAIVDRMNDDAASRFCSDIVNWLCSENISKYRQSSDQGPISGNFVFFPLQVRNDIVSRFTRFDPLVVLRHAGRIAKQRKIPLLVKRHPYCTSPLVRLSLKLACAGNRYVRETTASVNDLLANCGSVLVANSGVGFEAMLRNKPVYSFASSEYGGFSETIDAPDDIERAFAPQSLPPSSYGRRFASLYLKLFCFDAREPKSIRRLLDVAEASARADVWCEENRPDEPFFSDIIDE